MSQLFVPNHFLVIGNYNEIIDSREQKEQLENHEKEIAMLREVISSKDEIVMKTTNEVCLNSNMKNKKCPFFNEILIKDVCKFYCEVQFLIFKWEQTTLTVC